MTEDYFVQIPDARRVELQRLHVARKLLFCSASYLSLQAVREKKAELAAQLKTQTESLTSSFHELEDLLPNKELLKEISKPADLKKERKHVASAQVTESSTETNKFDKLQEALALIDKKIKSLDL
jgi:hypothetical protein